MLREALVNYDIRGDIGESYLFKFRGGGGGGGMAARRKIGY